MTRRKITRTIRAVISVGFLILPLAAPRSGVDAARSKAIDSICTSPVEVMPLGDSITTGKYSGHDRDVSVPEDDIGYRKDLWDLLTGAGYIVDFVGSEENGSTYPFSDPQHEGHNGWTDDQIADNIYNNGGENWLNLNPPDVILMHIGTNALNTDPSDVENILDEINEYEINTGSSVIVIVARIIDWVPNNPTVNTFNNNVEAMVTARPDYGSEVFMVDMEDGAGMNYSIYPGDPAGDMVDGLHPYASGYTKMANVWKAKFDEIYAFCGVNNPPDVTPVSDQSDDEGETIVPLSIEASDPDEDTLTYSAVNLPDGLSIQSTTGLISGTIGGDASNGSPYHVQVTVSDGKPLGSTTIGFDWAISGINYPPQITQPADQFDIEGDSVSLQIVATDPDGDDLAYSALGLPSGLSINTSTGLISGTIDSGESAFSPFDVDVTVSDGIADPVPATFTWTVNFPNAPPEIVQPANQVNKEGDTVSLQIEATDLDEDSLEYSALELPTGLSINASTGEISGAILSGASTFSPYAVTVTVDDGIADPVPATFNWLIAPNAPPQITQPADQVNKEGDTESLQIAASDPDEDSLVYSALGLPTSLSINASTGLISGAIQSGASTFSPYTVTVAVDDQIAAPVSATFTWTVKSPLYFIYLPLLTE